MTLVQLNYLITIAQTKSLNKAASILYVSQPSLTNAIKELENELGITLFYRSGRGMTLTSDGHEFLLHAKEIYALYEDVIQKYDKSGNSKKKFAVSCQHFSFVVQAFVDIVKSYGASKYEFALRETQTIETIKDVSTLRSEIGILYLSDFNRKSITKLLNTYSLEFHQLIECKPHVYLWKDHPLAKKDSITSEELKEYPCLSFEQGEESIFNLSEDISANKYSQVITLNDRATLFNLMIGLNGYTLCSGLICEELNGTDYVAIPYKDEENNSMQIGYITRKNAILTEVGEKYIQSLQNCLK